MELGGGNSSLPNSVEAEIRSEVEADVSAKYGSSKNPVIQMLLEVGMLEDMEVLRRCMMQAKDNKGVYLYSNKLAGLKTYAGLVKDIYSAQEKQAKLDDRKNADEDVDGIEILMRRDYGEDKD